MIGLIVFWNVVSEVRFDVPPTHRSYGDVGRQPPSVDIQTSTYGGRFSQGSY